MERLTISDLNKNHAAVIGQTEDDHWQARKADLPRFNNEQSKLLALPRELRDLIYSFAFVDTEVQPSSRGLEAPGASLLLTCQQVYLEARKPYYQDSIFFVKRPSEARIFIGRLPEEVRPWIKRIRLGGYDYGHVIMQFMEVWCARGLGSYKLEASFLSRVGKPIWYTADQFESFQAFGEYYASWRPRA